MPLNPKQRRAIALANEDVKNHWAVMLKTTPEEIQTALDGNDKELSAFRAVFKNTVRIVIERVYEKQA